VARQMHEHKQAEVPEAEVLAHVAQALPDLGHKANGAQQIVAEIRDRSGVLVERRPGFFAFSHLLFQEYLTALTFVPQTYKELVNHYEDPWWHEVIVLAAGTQSADAGRLASELLRKQGPAATFLAAQCLETAVQMPLEVREEIEKRLAQFVPPKTLDDAEKLIALGALAAPALTKAIGGKLSVYEAAWTFAALAFIDYEPTMSALARFITDFDRKDSLGYLRSAAMFALARKGLSSRLAKATFIALVPKLLPEEAIFLAHMLKRHLRGSALENREHEILQELLDTLPAEAKKD